MRAAMIAMPNKAGQDVAHLREESVMTSFLTGLNAPEGRIILWLGGHKSLAEMRAALDYYHMLRQDKRALMANHPNEREFARVVQDFVSPDQRLAIGHCNVAQQERNPKNYWRPLPAEGSADAIDWDTMKAYVKEIRRRLDAVEKRPQPLPQSVPKTGANRGRGKNRGKGGSNKNPNQTSNSGQRPPGARVPECDAKCFRCQKQGHFVRNCPEPDGVKSKICVVFPEIYCPGTENGHVCSCGGGCAVHWNNDNLLALANEIVEDEDGSEEGGSSDNAVA